MGSRDQLEFTFCRSGMEAGLVWPSWGTVNTRFELPGRYSIYLGGKASLKEALTWPSPRMRGKGSILFRLLPRMTERCMQL
jgi:hypothetical protein